MNNYILTHDIGTSGNKATLFSTDGEIITNKLIPYETHYFQGNRAEQNPVDWWKAVCDATQAITMDIDKNKIKVISFSGHSNGCVCVDKSGSPLRQAIIHSDLRSVEEVRQIKNQIDEDVVFEITGQRLSPSFTLEKFLWVKNHEPEVYNNTYKVLNAKDFIVQKLTNNAVTDTTDASMTGAFDLKKMRWSEELIDLLGISIDKFPDIHNSTFVAGGITKEAADDTGLKKGTPVVIGGGDGQCGFFGIAGTNIGKVYIYIGSTATVSTAVNKLIMDKHKNTMVNCHPVPGLYKYYATMQAAGSSYTWLKDEICVSETKEAKIRGLSPYDLMNLKIEKSPAGARGLIFLPYLLGERSPYWNQNAKGAFIGIGVHHKREDIIRAVVEGVIFNINTNLNIISKNLKIPVNDVIVYGGGIKGEIWGRILADILNVAVFTPNRPDECASIGAAILAGIGVGIFNDYNVNERFLRIEEKQTPDLKNVELYKKMQGIFENAYLSLIGTFDELSGIIN